MFQKIGVNMWISCKSRLPKRKNHVFIKDRFDNIYLAYLTEKTMIDSWHIPEGNYFKIITGGTIRIDDVKEWYELN